MKGIPFLHRAASVPRSSRMGNGVPRGADRSLDPVDGTEDRGDVFAVFVTGLG
jgi:hypothetical protein